MISIMKLLKPNLIDHISYNCVRFQSSGKIRHMGFNYYPRFPEQQDTPVKPSKLFMVKLTKSFRGQPWWDRKLLVELGLNAKEDINKVVVLKNIPEICAKLWKVKHLVKIIPVTFPDGEPTEKDIGSTFLDSAGRMHISDRYREDPAAVRAYKDYREGEKFLDRDTKTEDSRRKWNLGMVLD